MRQGRILNTVVDVIAYMLDKIEATKYFLVFFEPKAHYIYHRASDDQTAFEEIRFSATGVSEESFEHHCHPYFAIQNALPKFYSYEEKLTTKQAELFKHL